MRKLKTAETKHKNSPCSNTLGQTERSSWSPQNFQWRQWTQPMLRTTWGCPYKEYTCASPALESLSRVQVCPFPGHWPRDDCLKRWKFMVNFWTIFEKWNFCWKMPLAVLFFLRQNTIKGKNYLHRIQIFRCFCAKYSFLSKNSIFGNNNSLNKQGGE